MACTETSHLFLNVVAEKDKVSQCRKHSQNEYWESYSRAFLGAVSDLFSWDYSHEYNCKIADLLPSTQCMKRINDIRLERSKITLAITNNLLKYSIKEMYFSPEMRTVPFGTDVLTERTNPIKFVKVRVLAPLAAEWLVKSNNSWQAQLWIVEEEKCNWALKANKRQAAV